MLAAPGAARSGSTREGWAPGGRGFNPVAHAMWTGLATNLPVQSLEFGPGQTSPGEKSREGLTLGGWKRGTLSMILWGWASS